MLRLRCAALIGILSLGTLAAQAFGQTITFRDGSGAAASTYVEGGQAIVQVEDSAANVSGAPDTVQARLTSTRGGDEELLTLTETGPSSGIFRGGIQLAPANGSSKPGVLETAADFNPPYERDTIRAEYGSASATAAMVGSRIFFLDDYGRPAPQVIAGSQIQFRLIAPLANTSPYLQDSVSISVTTENGDSEYAYLTETGAGTGIFEGGRPSTRHAAFPQDSFIDIFPVGQAVTAEFYDPDLPTSSRVSVPSVDSRVELVDAAGRPAEFILESSRAYVELRTRPGAPAPQVKLTSDLAGDVEVLTLSLDSSGEAFRGSIPMRRGPAIPNNGILETTEADSPARFDTVRLTEYPTPVTADAVPTIGSLTSFRDEYGNEVSRYAAGSAVVVRVEDHNFDDPGVFDTVQAVIQSLVTGDAETLTLLEISRNSGLFEGRIASSSGAPAPSDGRLQVQPGERIQAMHVDAFPQLASGALAAIDVLKVQFIDELGRPTTEILPGGPVRVRVISSGDNLDPSRAESLPVQLASRYAADQEAMTVTETGPNTGVFEGSIPSLVPSITPPDYSQTGQPGNGKLDLSGSGPPDFGPEVVTASVGPYSAEAHTVTARLMFIDDYGRPTESIPYGNQVRIRVIDYTLNDPQRQDLISLQIASRQDYEYVTLQETGYDTGVFEGAIPVASLQYRFPYNGQLSTEPGDQVFAEYAGAFGSMLRVYLRISGGQVMFVDAAGQPASTYLEGTQVRVRVIDSGANRRLSPPETVTVSLSTDLSGDAETLTLTELADQPGVFEGTIPLRHGPVLSNSGSIEPGEDNGTPHQFDTIRVSYATSYNGEVSASAVGVESFRIGFVDADGNATDHYAQGSRLFVRLEDHRDGDPGVFDRQTVRLRSSAGDQENLELLETGRATGIFQGSMPIDGGAPGPDARLQASPGSEITAEALTGYTAEPARARIDALSIEFIDDAGHATTELLAGGVVRVRVISSGDDTNPSQVETLPVQLASRNAVDQEVIQLTETGPATGVFEGAIPSWIPALNPPDYNPVGQPGNGRLDLANSGPPAFGPEVVTASVGPYSAEASTIAVRMLFIDDYGRPTTTFPFGSQVRMRVIDYTRNDPQFRDRVSIQIASGGDSEYLELQETGYDTGVFEGGMQTVSNGYYYDGRLSTAPGVTVTAYYGSYFSTDQVTIQAKITAGQVLFVDAAGQPASIYLEGTRARVRVIDQGANRQAFQADTVTVSLSTDLSGDAESLTLTETGTQTGIFEGTIQLRHGPVLPHDGAIEPGEDSGPPHQFDTIRVSYTGSDSEASASSAGVQNFRLWFIDPDGNVTDHFAQGSRLYARVEDHRDDDPGAFDHQTVQVQSSSGDVEVLEVLETGTSTGIFEGSMPLDNGAPGPDARLQAAPGSEITAVLAAGYTAEPARARIDALTVEFIDDAGRVTTELLGGGPVRVRVISSGDNADPSQPETLPVQIASRWAADQETFQLTETGPDTGVFEGVIPSRIPAFLPPYYSPQGEPGNGSLELANSGPPEFGPEVVTASVGPYSAVATTVSTRMLFIDEAGHPAASFPQGGQVRLRVTDYTRNDPGLQDILTVQIASLADYEYFNLFETGLDTGVFEGSMPTTSQVIYYNGELATAPGITVTAYYGDYFHPDLVTAQAQITGGRVLFVDETGQPASTVEEGTQARLRVEDHGQSGAVTVEVDTRITGDQENVTLQETGPGTGIFEGSISLVNAASAIRGNGIVETGRFQAPIVQYDALNAFYADSPAATAGVVPAASNGAPRAVDDTAETTAGHPVVIAVLANDSDPDNDPLSIVSITQGQNGTVTVNPDNTVTYTPNPGFPVGSDSFTYGVSDSRDGQAIGHVTVTVNPDNHPPVANDDTATVAGNDAATNNSVLTWALGNDTDPDGDELTLEAITVLPAHGTATTISDGLVYYKPAPGFTGQDEFTYQIRDRWNATARARVTVTVTRINHPPVAEADSAHINQGGSATIDVLANDSDLDGDPITIIAADGVINPDRTVTFTPRPTVIGFFPFRYTISDGKGGTATGDVTLFVNALPEANADTATVTEDGAVDVAVLANDTDRNFDPLTVTAVTQGAHGTVAINPDKTVKYTPAANYNGSDSFTYTVSDGKPGGTATATASVTITAVNDAPVANADSATVEEDGAADVAVLANDTDAEGDLLTVTAVTQGSHGVVAINPDKTVKYTPAANYNGPDSFTYTVSDGNGGTATGTVSVTVTSGNDAPVANADTATVAEDGTVSINVLGNDSDPDGDALTVAAVTQGSHGTVAINPDKTVKYTPAANYNGADAFAYTISDGNGGTASGTVVINVTPVNDAPVAVNDAATVAAGSPVTVSVLANDADLDGPVLAVSAVTQGTRGTVTINADQTVTYTAGLYIGADSFTYTVSDGAGGTATATVAVNVTAPARVSTGIQARYDFNEGSGNTIQDTSGAGAALDLTIGKPSATAWTAGGLTVLSNAEIESVTNATKIISAAQSSNAITMEAWVRPSSLSLNNGRIAMISKNPAQRNLVFAQSGSLYEAQLRTSSGTSSLQTPSGSASLDLVHLVYTRASSGQSAWYLNGIQVSTQTAAGALSNWSSDQKLIFSENWQGTYFLLAIYGRALDAAEVQQNYLAGANAN